MSSGYQLCTISQASELLAGQHRNISVVSDDDQCIFRFRGAAYSNILNFIKEYPDASRSALSRITAQRR